MKGALLVFFFFVCVSISNAQVFRAYTNKDTARIGEPVLLVLTIEDAPKNFDFHPYSGTLPCEMKQTGEQIWKENAELEIEKYSDTTYVKKGKRIWKANYTLLAWDSAVYRLPEFAVTVNKSVLKKRPVNLVVVFKKRKVDDSITEVKVHEKTDPYVYLKKYGWIILVLIALITTLFILNKRRKLQPKKHTSLKQDTLEKLAKIRAKEDWKHGRIPEHYVSFSRLVRSFLGIVFELNLMERTTYETIKLLELKQVDKEVIYRIERLLKDADVIKFGKTVPDELNTLQSLNRFEELVIELSPLDLIE